MTVLDDLERSGIMGDSLRKNGSWEETPPELRQKIGEKFVDTFPPWRTQLESDMIRHAILMGIPFALSYMHPSMIDYTDLEPIRNEEIPYGVIRKFLPRKDYLKNFLEVGEVLEPGYVSVNPSYHLIF